MNSEMVAQPDAPLNMVRYEAARKALKEARDFDEVKTIRDKTQALTLYAKQARDTEMARWVSDIKIRAERRCGEMLKATAESGERATSQDNLKQSPKGHNVISANKKTLAQMGVPTKKSSRYQKLAAIPEETFEAALEESAKKKGIPTTAGVMRAAKELERVLKEGAEMAADIEENSRRAQARNAKDPQFQSVKAWTMLIFHVNACMKDINKMQQADSVLPCPPDELDALLRNWVAVSDFISQYGRQP